MGRGRILAMALAGALILTAASAVYAYTLKAPAKVQEFQGTLVGLVEVSAQGDVYVTTNWRSRSRASYRVTGALKEEVAQHKGQVVKVEGLITKKSPWSGTIEVEKVLEVEKAPEEKSR